METHAARWGLLRGCSSKATKWVDFVMTDSTRRESCHSVKISGILCGVKREIVEKRGVSQRGTGWVGPVDCLGIKYRHFNEISGYPFP